MAVYFAIEEYISSKIETAGKSLLIVCPFIKIAALTRLIKHVPDSVKVTIVSTWKFKNFVAGVSDVELFTFCRHKGIRLFINNRIHLKLWAIDDSLLLISSANITDSALGFSSVPNHEVLTDITMGDQDMMAIDEIISTSCEVSETVYLKTVDLLSAAKKLEYDEIELIDIDIPLMNLVETLPIVADPDELYEAYSSQGAELSEEARHDLDYLKIPPSLSQQAFRIAIERSYFRLPIVRKVCEKLAESPVYFGEMKAFLQDINDSDPKPTRRELTPITQNLYRWLTSLRPDNFLVDQPNHSERITLLNTLSNIE